MSNFPDHPDIANAIRYGYPHTPRERIYCTCGAPAQCWGATSGYKCFDCAKKEFEDLTDEEAVEILGFEVIEE